MGGFLDFHQHDILALNVQDNHEQDPMTLFKISIRFNRVLKLVHGSSSRLPVRAISSTTRLLLQTANGSFYAATPADLKKGRVEAG